MGQQIEASLTIDASPEHVWSILTDTARYAEWNPFITAVSGSLQPGGRLSIRIVPPGKGGMTFKPTVLAVHAARELRWRGRLLMPGIFDGEHYFLLEPGGRNGTRFTQGETFNGLLVGFVGGLLKSTEEGFRSMNEALKAEAEKGASGLQRTS